MCMYKSCVPIPAFSGGLALLPRTREELQMPGSDIESRDLLPSLAYGRGAENIELKIPEHARCGGEVPLPRLDL